MTTLRAELVALLKTFNGGIDVYADTPPEGVPYPFVVVSVDVNITPIMGGDAETIATRRLVQVSLWQELDNEDEVLGQNLYDLMDGYQVTGGGGMRLRVTNVIRYGDPDYPLIHRVFDVSVASLRV